ncbi:MAG TPA: TonB family protein [Caulobacteraceae bacterium]|nr:TonB family protein [Caulobacteraceae bacterium]
MATDGASGRWIAGARSGALAFVFGCSLQIQPGLAAGRPTGPVPVVDFSIPAQPLAAALDAYSAESGVQVLYASALAQDRRSPGVAGRINPTDALQQLLAGTGLVARYTDGRAAAFVLVPAQGPTDAGLPPSYAGPIMALDTIHVEGPPVLKGGGGGHELYARYVQSGILVALRRDRLLRGQSYAVSLHVWVGASGRLDRAEVFNGAGDAALDRHIVEAVQGLSIDQPPPRDLPQPVHVVVAVKTAATNDR